MTCSLENSSFIKESQPIVQINDTDIKSLLNHFVKNKITLFELVDRILFCDDQTLQEQSKELNILFDSVIEEDVDISTQASASELIESGNPVRMKFGIWILSKCIQTHADRKILSYLREKIESIPSAERCNYTFLISNIKTSFFLALDSNHYEEAILCLNNLHLLPLNADLDLEMPKLVHRLLQAIESEQDASKQKNARDTFCAQLSAFHLKWQAQTFIYLQIASILLKKEYGKVKEFQETLFTAILISYSEKKTNLVENMFVAPYARLFLNLDSAVVLKDKVLSDWYRPNQESLTNYFKKDVLLCTQWAHFLIDTTYEKTGMEQVFAFIRDAKYCGDQGIRNSWHAYLVCLFSRKKIRLKNHLDVIVAFINKENPKETKNQIKYWTDELLALEKGKWVNRKPLVLKWLKTFPKVLENNYGQGVKLLKNFKQYLRDENEFFDKQVYLVDYWIQRNNFNQALSAAQEWQIVWKVAESILKIIKVDDATQLSEKVISFIKENLTKLAAEEIVNFYPILVSTGQETMIKCAEVVLAIKSLIKIKFIIPPRKAQQIIECFNYGFEENWKKPILDNMEIVPYLLSQAGGLKAHKNEEWLTNIWKALYENGSATKICAFNRQLLPLDIDISPSQSKGLLESHFKEDITGYLQKMLFIVQLLSHGSATVHDKDLHNQLVEISRSIKGCKFDKKQEFRLAAILSLLSKSGEKKRIRVNKVIQIYVWFQLNSQFRSVPYRVMLNKSMEDYLANNEPILGAAILCNIIDEMGKKSIKKTAFTFYCLWDFMNGEWAKKNLTLEEKRVIFKEPILCTLERLDPSEEIYLHREERKEEINLYLGLLENILVSLEIIFQDEVSEFVVKNFADLVFFLEKIITDDEIDLIMSKIVSFCESCENEKFIRVFGERFLNYYLKVLRYHFLEAPIEKKYVEWFFYKMLEYVTSKLSLPMLIALRTLLETKQKHLYGVHLSGRCIRDFSEKYLNIPKMLPDNILENVKEEFIGEWRKYTPVIPDVSIQDEITLNFMRQWFDFHDSGSEEDLESCANEYENKILKSEEISLQKMVELNFHVLKYFIGCLNSMQNAVDYPFSLIFNFFTAVCKTSFSQIDTLKVKGKEHFDDRTVKYFIYITRNAQHLCIFYMKNIKAIPIDANSLIAFADALLSLTWQVKKIPDAKRNTDAFRKTLHFLNYPLSLLTTVMSKKKTPQDKLPFAEKMFSFIGYLEADYSLLSKDEIEHISDLISVNLDNDCPCKACEKLQEARKKYMRIMGLPYTS